MLDDPSSKNGTIVDGVLSRRKILEDGALLELGRSFFLFRQGMVLAVPSHLAGDVDETGLPSWPRTMNTFSPVLARDFEALARLAASTVSVVLLGETGTGKEVIARAVHTMSRRRGELVAVNCGGISAGLIEAELFGHRRGAFTGAVGEQRGLVRTADHGTLFLDEIGELPSASQTAFLRVLQERTVLTVGDDRPTAVDLRLIVATLRDLDEAVEAGTFREDLYARIAGHTVVLPPLRERREDLGLLIAELVPRIAVGRPIRLAATSLRALLRHDWPHNIRELEKALSAAIALAPGEVIELEHLPPSVRKGPSPRPGVAQPLLLDEPARELREKLVALFAEHGGSVNAVALALGKERTQVYRWIKRLAIDLSEFRRLG